MTARRGRRPGEPGTRGEILEAARSAFALHGYERATIRLVAAEAGVDPSLIHHYFGSKEQLFAAAVDVSIDVGAALDWVFVDGLEHAGEGLARLFFTIWENEISRTALLGQLRRGLTEGEMPPIFPEFVQRVILSRVAQHLEGPERALRAELAASQLVGLAILRYVAGIEPVASAPVETVIEMVAPRIQTYLIAPPT